MPPVVVQYLVQVPTEDEIVLDPPIGSFEVDAASASALTLSEIRDAWPFAGAFRFRVRFALAPEATVGWLDLIADTDEVPVTNGVAIVRALPLFPISTSGPASDFTLSPVEYEAWLHENALRRAAESRIQEERGGGEETELPRVEADSSPRPQPAFAPAPAAGSARTDRASTAGSDPWGVFGDAPAAPIPPGGGAGSSASAAIPSAAAIAESATAIAGNMLKGFRGFMASASRAVAASAGGSEGGHAAASTAEPAAAAAASKPASGGFLSGFAKGARGMLASAAKAIDKTLQAGAGGGGGAASPEAAAALAALQRLLRTPARADSAPHEGVLRRLWAAAYGADEPFALPSPLWAQLGFDGEDPCAALNHQGAGVLALYALTHVAETHGAVFDEMLARAVSAAASDVTDSAGPYPPALAVMALSCRLAAVLGLDGDSTVPGHEREPFWEVFGGARGQEAFYELVGLAWRAFDRAWLEEAARAADFERVVDAAAARARGWLERGPQSLDQLISSAEMEGVALSRSSGGAARRRSDDD